MANREALELVYLMQRMAGIEEQEAVGKLIDALDEVGNMVIQLETEKKFFENLSMELIKEKQKRIRDEKGVFYVGKQGYLYEEQPDTEYEDADLIMERCDGCMCADCEKVCDPKCAERVGRCEECVDLVEDGE